mgnify:CR=1 FL=1
MRIIGLAGRKRSGKDTVGKYICDTYGFMPESFARPLKESIRIIYGWTSDHTDGELKEVTCPYWKVTPRTVMQQPGTEIGRQLDRDIWRKSMERRLMTVMQHDDESRIPVGVIITDVRFPNEADGIRELGGEIWRITRPTLGPQTDLHPSETSLDRYRFDREVENDGSMEDLYAKVRVLLCGNIE